ncbi:MAG: hypothetical protein FWD57_16620 [Polyangiaceae bacterium]|nr:hypothetical protein [Polyangiaceae bacterium]
MPFKYTLLIGVPARTRYSKELRNGSVEQSKPVAVVWVVAIAVAEYYRPIEPTRDVDQWDIRTGWQAPVVQGCFEYLRAEVEPLCFEALGKREPGVFEVRQSWQVSVCVVSKLSGCFCECWAALPSQS